MNKKRSNMFIEMSQDMRVRALEAVKYLDGQDRAPVHGQMEITRADSGLAQKISEDSEDFSVYYKFSHQGTEYIVFSESKKSDNR